MKKFVLWLCILIMTLTSCTTAVPETEIYVPSYEVACITEAIRNYADIRAPLPQGWEYKVIEETDDYGNEIFGIRFWPTEHPELTVRIGWRPGMTHPDNTSPGTRTKINLPDGNILWHHTKRQGEDAQSIIVSWDNYPFLYLAEYILPDTLEAEYEPIIREILSFTKFGGIRSMYEARDLVIALFEGNVALAGFHDIDLNTGAGCIFVDETETAPRRYFYVSKEDTIREYFMEDQPIGGTGIVFREREDTQ